MKGIVYQSKNYRILALMLCWEMVVVVRFINVHLSLYIILLCKLVLGISIVLCSLFEWAVLCSLATMHPY